MGQSSPLAPLSISELNLLSNHTGLIKHQDQRRVGDDKPTNAGRGVEFRLLGLDRDTDAPILSVSLDGSVGGVVGLLQQVNPHIGHGEVVDWLVPRLVHD